MCSLVLVLLLGPGLRAGLSLGHHVGLSLSHRLGERLGLHFGVRGRLRIVPVLLLGGRFGIHIGFGVRLGADRGALVVLLSLYLGVRGHLGLDRGLCPGGPVEAEQSDSGGDPHRQPCFPVFCQLYHVAPSQ